MRQTEREKDVRIKVQNVHKYFRIYKDKNHTFKDRVLNYKRNKYELNRVLNDVSFQVGKGEVIGLIGHNGCGKSTTLKLLNHILYPDQGTIEMRGRISGLIELGAGFHPDMTGRENIYINASIFGLKKKEIDERLDKIIRFSELESFIDNPVRTYSSGMYMRLAFSIAINVDADILLVDEILAVGGANFQKKCFDKLSQIKEKGTTIVIVSHSMEQIKSICNRVIWLEEGKIRMDGDPRTVCAEYLDSMENVAAQRQALEDQQEINTEEIKTSLRKTVSEQCSKHAKRTGNQEVHFTSVSMENKEHDLCVEFGVEDEMIVRGNITAKKKTKVNLSLKIFNKYGGHCSTLESNWQYGENVDFFEKMVFELKLDQLRLVPGYYYIDLVIFDELGTICDNISRCFDFVIGPLSGTGRDNLGIVAQKANWEIYKA